LSGGFAFGGGQSGVNTSFGGISSPPQPGGQAMFSIGSGTGTPKGRTIAKARRTRQQR
jgi:hypothetical protein